MTPEPVSSEGDLTGASVCHAAADDRARVIDRVRALVESWPHGDNGQDYRRAVIQCRSAVLAALGEQP